jgi:dihydromonapterin reductase/dihydrofolate reductase
LRWTQKGHILITGATQRVGLHCVERFLAAGERLVITYRKDKPVVRKLQEQGVICIAADFTCSDSIAALVRSLHADVGPLRAIIHNASCWPVDSAPDTDYDRVLDEVLAVHIRAPYLLNMQCGDLLREGALV